MSESGNEPARTHTAPADDPATDQDTERQGQPLTDSEVAPTVDYDQRSRRQVSEVIKRFGDYEILKEIAHGGMGVVYQARQVSLNRIVALKMIRSGDLATQQEADRFRTEAEAAANLDHPNIVSIFEVGQHEGQHFFSMAYVEGESLASKIREHALPGRAAAEYCRTIAAAIHYAHQHQTLHRDIKPSNVLIDKTGQPRVTDFGLAKRVGSDSDLTATGQVLGTPNYMSPEQAMGDNQRVGPRSDVYSLGATLYALTTGRPPFQADTTVATLLQVIDKEPVAPRELNPAIDVDLETVCLKCLDKEPANRYGSAEELAADLDRYLRREPILARPISRPARLGRWCKRNPVVAGLLAVVAVTLLAGIFISSVFGVTASRKAQQARIAEGKARSEEKKARIEEQNAKDAEAKARSAESRALDLVRQLEEEQERLVFENYVANTSVVQGKIRDGIHGAASLALEKAPAKLRHWEWGHLVNLCYAEALKIQGVNGGLYIDMATTPDMRRVVFFGKKIQVWNVTDASLVREITECTAGCLSPTGDKLLVAHETEVICQDLDSGEELFRWPERTAAVRGLKWLPQKDRVLEGLEGRIKRMVHADDGTVIRTLSEEVGNWHPVSFSNDGRRVLLKSSRTGRVWDIEDDKQVFQVEQVFNQSNCSVAMSDDGRRVLSGHSEMTSKLWDVDTGELLQEIANQRGQVRAVAFSPDGRHAASGGTFGVQYWDLETGELIREFGSHDEHVASITFPSDPRWLLAANIEKQLKIWDTQRQAGIVTFSPESHQKAFTYCQLAISDDGKTVITTGWEHAGVRVFDTEAETVRWEFTPGRAAKRVSISPDGHWALTTDGNATIWDLHTGEKAGSIKVGSFAMHPDSRRFAAPRGKEGVCIFSLPDCEKLTNFKPNGKGMECLDFSSDGRFLLGRQADFFVVWDLQEQQCRNSVAHKRPSPGTGATDVGVFFPDNRRVLLSDVKGGLIWDSATGETTLLNLGTTVASVAVSPDGKRAFLGCWDKTVRVWDVDSAREVMSFSPHSGGISSLDISKDGRVLVAGGCGGARDVTVYRSVDWRKSPEELQQAKLDQWRARFEQPAAEETK